MRMLNGRYRLDHRIAVGGASEVWRGQDEMLDRAVAVKVMTLGPGRVADPPDGLSEVRAEARAAAALTHPNIAGVYDFGASDAAAGLAIRYIVMELAEGETLARHLRAGPLDWQIAVRVCAEVCAALAAAHLHGVVHRDIKPANVILTPYGAKVLDFGISVMSGNDDVLSDGNLVGTPAFMAPERFGGVAAAPPTDMYAVGVLLYLCLVGRLPWPAPTDPHQRPTAPTTPPRPLPPIPGLPVEIAELCLACLDSDPERRPTSFLAAVLLAEAVDATIHLPPVATAAPDEPAAVSPWTRAAAEAATNHAVEAVTDRAVGSPEPPAGRHRA
jgi:serine/threonine-protein kinase